MNVDQDESGKQLERSESENRRGRNDIMLDHITANGFAGELAKRLWADYEERICEVRRVIGLATQAIENAQRNTTNTMKEAVAVLLGKAGVTEVVDPKRAAMYAEVTPYNVKNSDRYLLMAWLKSLSGEYRRQAAEAIIARMRELSGNDDEIVARNLTGFSNEVYESTPVAPFDNYRTCWKYDYGQDFAEEVDLLWSVLLEKKVANVYPRLRMLLGDERMWAGQRGRDLKDFSLHEVKEAFKDKE
jgi:hypothetical protein